LKYFDLHGTSIENETNYSVDESLHFFIQNKLNKTLLSMSIVIWLR